MPRSKRRIFNKIRKTRKGGASQGANKNATNAKNSLNNPAPAQSTNKSAPAQSTNPAQSTTKPPPTPSAPAKGFCAIS